MQHFTTNMSSGPSHHFGSPATPGGTACDVLFAADPVNEHDDELATNETLERLLKEVNLAVAGDDDENEDEDSPRHRLGAAANGNGNGTARHAGRFPHDDGDDRGGPFPSFSVSAAAALVADLYPGGAAGGRSLTSQPAAGGGGGFVVEGSTTSLPHLGGTPLHHGIPPPPPPPPPMYGTPAVGPATPYGCYGAAPASLKAPPSFAEAIASTTPLSLPGRSPADHTPMTAHYIPPGPAALPDPIILRNANGIFLLNPMPGGAKPTPAYTPQTATNTPPVSPLPRYSLPPAQGAVSATAFLGSSAMQQQQQQHQMHSRTRSGDAMGGPPPPPPPPQYGTSPFLGYAPGLASARVTPSFGAAPPPYGA